MFCDHSLFLNIDIKTLLHHFRQDSHDLNFFAGEQGLIDEAQRALEEAEALKKVYCLVSFS